MFVLGVGFVEFIVEDPYSLENLFQKFGFTKQLTPDYDLYTFGVAEFRVRTHLSASQQKFYDIHGDGVYNIGFIVDDCDLVYKKALAFGAEPCSDVPCAFYGVGGLIHTLLPANLIKQNGSALLKTKLDGIDHIAINLFRDNTKKWVEFYRQILGFDVLDSYEIMGSHTGLKTTILSTPDRSVMMPLNESIGEKSQINEFLELFKGEGVQHLALTSQNILESVDVLTANKIPFMETSSSYYERLKERYNSFENIQHLQSRHILLDGKSMSESLLQIFTKPLIGPLFFEIIQRKGDLGFGEANIKALFESIELDQQQRGVL